MPCGCIKFPLKQKYKKCLTMRTDRHSSGSTGHPIIPTSSTSIPAGSSKDAQLDALLSGPLPLFTDRSAGLSTAAIELLSIRRESSCHKRMQEKVKKSGRAKKQQAEAHSRSKKKKNTIINKEMLLPAGKRWLLLLATSGSHGSAVKIAPSELRCE